MTPVPAAPSTPPAGAGRVPWPSTHPLHGHGCLHLRRHGIHAGCHAEPIHTFVLFADGVLSVHTCTLYILLLKSLKFRRCQLRSRPGLSWDSGVWGAAPSQPLPRGSPQKCLRAPTGPQRGSDKSKPSPKTMAAFPGVLSTAMPGPLCSSWVTHRICPPGRGRAGKASMASADPPGHKALDRMVGCIPFLPQGTRSLRLAKTPGATAATQRL